MGEVRLCQTAPYMSGHSRFLFWSSGFRICFVFRISDFEFASDLPHPGGRIGLTAPAPEILIVSLSCRPTRGANGSYDHDNNQIVVRAAPNIAGGPPVVGPDVLLTQTRAVTSHSATSHAYAGWSVPPHANSGMAGPLGPLAEMAMPRSGPTMAWHR